MWRRLDHALEKVSRCGVYISAIAAALIMMLSVIDIVGAKIFSWGIPAQVEMVQQLNVIMVFGSIAYVAIKGGHMRIDTLDSYLSPVAKFVLRLFSNVIETLLVGILAWLALLLTKNYIETKLVVGGMTTIILWPFALVTCLGLTLLTLALISNTVKEIKAGIRGKA